MQFLKPTGFWSPSPVVFKLLSMYSTFSISVLVQACVHLNLPLTYTGSLDYAVFLSLYIPKSISAFCVLPLLRNNGCTPSCSKTRSGPLRTNLPKPCTPFPREYMSVLPDTAKQVPNKHTAEIFPTLWSPGHSSLLTTSTTCFSLPVMKISPTAGRNWLSSHFHSHCLSLSWALRSCITLPTSLVSSRSSYK